MNIPNPRFDAEVGLGTENLEDLEALLCREGLDLRLTKLEAGPFSGLCRLLDLPGLRVLRLVADRNLQIQGSLPTGTLGVVIPIEAGPELRCDGAAIGGDQVMLLPSAQGFDITTGGTVDLMMALVERRPNAPMAAALDGSQAASVVVGPDPAHVRQDALVGLRDVAAAVLPPDGSSKHVGAKCLAVRRSRTEEFTKRLVPVLESSREAGGTATATTRERQARCARRARDFMEANLRRRVKFEELQRVSGTSLRTLHYAFRDYFGIAPITYHKCRRLRCVREALRCAAPAETSVTEISMDWGFWHIGRFAVDYKAMFGESPNTTLRREHSAFGGDRPRSPTLSRRSSGAWEPAESAAGAIPA